MVSVFPLAVASITLDWSGPVTTQFLRSAVDRVREVLDRRFSGGLAAHVVIGTAARVHADVESRWSIGRSRRTCWISPSPTGFVDVTRTHPSSVTSAVASRPAAPNAALISAATCLCGHCQRPPSGRRRWLVPSMMNVSVSFTRRRDLERSRRVRPAGCHAAMRQRVVERHDGNAIDGGDVADLLQLVRRVVRIERVVREVHRVPDLQLQFAGRRVEIGRVQVDGAVGRGERLRGNW